MIALEATPAMIEQAVRPVREERWTRFADALNAGMVLVEQTETGLKVWSMAKLEKSAEWIVKQLRNRSSSGFQFITTHKESPAYKISDFGPNQRAIVNGIVCNVNVYPIRGNVARCVCNPWEGGPDFTEVCTLDTELTIA